jgi:hypothetical protein
MNLLVYASNGSARGNAGPMPNVVITSDSDESDFVDRPPNKKRQPKQEDNDNPRPRAQQPTSFQGPHDTTAKNTKVRTITRSPWYCKCSVQLVVNYDIFTVCNVMVHAVTFGHLLQ